MNNQYPEQTHSVLLTNVGDDGENVMCYTSLSVDVLTRAFAGRSTWDEAYIVPAEDRQYYLSEPLHLTIAEEEQARKLANQTA